MTRATVDVINAAYIHGFIDEKQHKMLLDMQKDDNYAVLYKREGIDIITIHWRIEFEKTIGE